VYLIGLAFDCKGLGLNLLAICIGFRYSFRGNHALVHVKDSIQFAGNDVPVGQVRAILFSAFVVIDQPRAGALLAIPTARAIVLILILPVIAFSRACLDKRILTHAMKKFWLEKMKGYRFSLPSNDPLPSEGSPPIIEFELCRLYMSS
jgi:hypothetical protein